ncbi:MAG TPA: hypothetical protein VFR81_12075 [Longimicrobium sp.]|nr:hypothetical protein [Longimicrobium sp.]
MTTILDAEEQATTAAVGEEGPLTYPITEEQLTTLAVGEEVMSTMAEGEEGPTLRPGEELTGPGLEDPGQSISGIENPFGGF